MNKFITTGFHMVHLINFFTAGPDEVRVWTIRKGYKAPQAAGCIHTDFEKKFIMAKTMSFKDLHELGSEVAVKAAGKYRQHLKADVEQWMLSSWTYRTCRTTQPSPTQRLASSSGCSLHGPAGPQG